MSTKGRNNMGNSSDSDGDQTGNIKQLPLIKGGGSNMNMMNMQHMNNSFHHNSSQISETTYSMKAENQLVGGKKKNSSTFNTSKYMAHSPSPSQTFFKGKYKASRPFTLLAQSMEIFLIFHNRPCIYIYVYLIFIIKCAYDLLSNLFFSDSSKKGKKGLPPFVNANQKSKIYVSVFLQLLCQISDDALRNFLNRQFEYCHRSLLA